MPKRCRKKKSEAIRQENRRLVKRLSEGDEDARMLLVKINEPLAYHIGMKRTSGVLTPDEMVSAGRIGILRATYKFEIERGADFATYAAFWIRNALDEAVLQRLHTIRLPSAMAARVRHVNECREEFQRKNGSEPTPEEIAESLHLTVAKVKSALLTPEKTVSMHVFINESNDELEALIPDDAVQMPYEEIEHNDTMRLIHATLDSKRMTAREARMVRLRYGLPDHFGGEPGPGMTLGEVAEHFNITRERVRQILMQSIRKLREAMEERPVPHYFPKVI